MISNRFDSLQEAVEIIEKLERCMYNLDSDRYVTINFEHNTNEFDVESDYDINEDTDDSNYYNDDDLCEHANTPLDQHCRPCLLM